MAPKRSDERGEVAQCVASLFFLGGGRETVNGRLYLILIGAHSILSKMYC